MSEQIKKLMPKLRFPEFKDSEEWQKKRLNQLGDIVGGGTPSTTKTEFWKGAINWFTPTEIREKYVFKSNKTISHLGLQESSAKLLPVNTILLTTRATIGNVGICIQECTTNQGLQNIIVNKNNYYEFVYYLLFSNKAKLVEKSSGSTFQEISKIELSKIVFSIPFLEEQKKIAACLSSIDELITEQTNKITLLKNHKKGLMQHLFPAQGETVPKLRFPEFQNAGKWEEMSLSKIATFYKGKGLPKSAISSHGKYPCIHYGELFTQYFEVIDNVKSKTDAGNNCFRSIENDVIMPTSDVTPKGLAKASCVNLNDVILGGDILVIRTNKFQVCGQFLSRLIRHLEKNVLQLVSGSTVFHLYASSLEKLKIKLPMFEEQQKIALCLSAVDEKITLNSLQLKTYKAHKKGLMQQLFPNAEEGNK